MIKSDNMIFTAIRFLILLFFLGISSCLFQDNVAEPERYIKLDFSQLGTDKADEISVSGINEAQTDTVSLYYWQAGSGPLSEEIEYPSSLSGRFFVLITGKQDGKTTISKVYEIVEGTGIVDVRELEIVNINFLLDGINDGDTVSNEIITLSGQVDSKPGIAAFSMNGEPVTLQSTRWSENVTLAEGGNVFEFTALDWKGNQLEQSVTVYYIFGAVDNTGPSLTVSQPQNNEIISVSSSSIIGTVSDPSGVLSVTVNGRNATNNGSRWQSNTLLSEGANSIDIIATDNKNNATEKSVTVYYNPLAIDSTPPTLSISKPGEADTVSVSPVLVTGTAWDNSGISSVMLGEHEAILETNGSWYGYAALSLGVNKLMVSTTDKSNRANTTYDTIMVVYDSTIADEAFDLVIITQPSNNTVVNTAVGITISGRAEDASGVSSVMVNSWQAQITGYTWTASINLDTLGNNRVTAIATDANGNKDSAWINLVYDTTAVDATKPSLALVSHTTGEVVGTDTMLIQVTANDANGITLVLIAGDTATLNGGKYERRVHLTPGSNNISVSAIDGSKSANSETLNFSLNYSAPKAPAGLTATSLSSSSIKIHWQPSDGASGYTVYRSVSASGNYVAVTAVLVSTSFTDASLGASTTFYYKVKAVNGAGTSDYSSSDSTTTQAPQVEKPGVPDDVKVTVTSASQVSVSWNVVSGATSYIIYQSSSASGSYTQVGITSSGPWVHSDLTANTVYYYKVSAQNTAGLSAQSNYAGSRTMTEPPVIQSVVTGDKSVTVSWNTVSGATSYVLYYASGTTVDKNGTRITGVSSPRVVTGIINGTQYAFALCAVNGSGESVLSGIHTGIPVSDSVPDTTGQLQPDKNTLALWHFNEASGNTVYDESGNGHNGVLFDFERSAGMFGRGLYFKKDVQCKLDLTTVISALNRMSYTIEFCIYITEAPAETADVFQIPKTIGVAATRTVIGYSPNTLSSHIDLTASNNIVDNKWHKIKCISDTKGFSLWLDGKRVQSRTQYLAGGMSSIDPIFIGGIGYSGYIDEIRISDVPRFTDYYTPGMKQIPGGQFDMGQPDISFGIDEQPVHSVTMFSFWMDSTEVTQGNYSSLMSNTYSSFSAPAWSNTSGKGNSYPAYIVNWYDAVLYCNARSLRDGLDTVYSYTSITGVPGNDCVIAGLTITLSKNGYHLPTEAQWEYAAKAGSTTDLYWGKDYNPYPVSKADSTEIGLYAVWSGNSHSLGSGNAGFGTHLVASKLPNSYGLYDMSGNVFEWCNDWYDVNYYGVSTNTEPQGPSHSSDGRRVLRGGSWDYNATNLRSAFRGRIAPDVEFINLGFRVAR
ncbi:MAG: SUMF1/EgtB/PvdO family nonheme iron enzyme [Fibrobacteria bacterium]|nr:SUMF1/EgtB/PvdO family nonheme iron enzyme [Fibrobacteria bacterium]